MSQSSFFFIASCLVLASVMAAPTEDLVDITTVPQIPEGQYNFQVYSGYFHVDNSTDLNRSLHYVFVTSQNNPTTDPVLLWLNGGPGCSSLDGFIYEHGPWVYSDNGTELFVNPNPWNANASVLYLETPGRVGFSVGPDITYNDSFTAQDNVRAVVEFHKKFPEFARNEFWISGESYAGIYVPTFAEAVHNHNQNATNEQINLKGFIVGNGVVNLGELDEIRSSVGFFARHNLIPNNVSQAFYANCYGNIQDFSKCNAAVEEAMTAREVKNLNPYHIYNPCFDDSNQTLPKEFQRDYARFFKMDGAPKHAMYNFGAINPFSELPPCADVLGATILFNNVAWKKAFHVPSETVWSICSQTLNYDGFQTKNLTDIYAFMLQKGYRIMFFSGDADSVCPIDGAIAFFNNLSSQYNILPTTLKKPWHAPGKYADEPQVNGFYQDYAENLRFLQFMGMGHMVPQWNRPGAQKVITSFIHNLPLE